MLQNVIEIVSTDIYVAVMFNQATKDLQNVFQIKRQTEIVRFFSIFHCNRRIIFLSLAITTNKLFLIHKLIAIYRNGVTGEIAMKTELEPEVEKFL